VDFTTDLGIVWAGAAGFPHRCEAAPLDCPHCGTRCVVYSTKTLRQYVEATVYTHDQGPLALRMYRAKCPSSSCGHVVYSTCTTKEKGFYYFKEACEEFIASTTETVFGASLMRKLDHDLFFNHVTFTGFWCVSESFQEHRGHPATEETSLTPRLQKFGKSHPC
jgi:hypothetical protein